MEHCPLCGTDTPVRTTGEKQRFSATPDPIREYVCDGCRIAWPPNDPLAWRSFAWSPDRPEIPVLTS